jgi:hypothetical protein
MSVEAMLTILTPSLLVLAMAAAFPGDPPPKSSWATEGRRSR